MKVIAEKVRSNYNNPSIGYVRPIFFFDENAGKYKTVESQMFPNSGEIFIYSGYNNIDQNFQEEEFFVIENVEPNNQGSYDPSVPRSCAYIATYNSVITLSGTEFLPVYESAFDLNNRKIDNFDSTKVLPCFINDGLFLYGPFEYDLDNNKWIPVNTSSFGLNEKEYFDPVTKLINEEEDCIFKYKIGDVSDLIVGSYLSDFRLLTGKELIDIIYIGSKEKTVVWGINFLKAQSFSVQEKEFIGKLKDVEIPNLSRKGDKQKLEKFRIHIGEVNDWINIAFPKFLNDYLNSEQGKKQREDYLNNNSQTFFENYRKNEINELDKQIDEKKNQLEELRVEEINLRKEQEGKENKIFEGLDEEDIISLKEFIKDNDARRKLIEFKKYEEFQKQTIREEAKRDLIADQIKGLEREKTNLESVFEGLKKAISNVKNDFFEETKFGQKLLEAKIYTDILNNIDPRNNVNSESNEQPYVSSSIKINVKEYDSFTFIGEITERLKKSNRSVEYNDVVNYLVCIQQNFLTVIAGLPGVGKTSLVEKISKALGCYDNKKYLSIAVQKGWTSSKDLIGYFNPLLQKYQPSKTGLYKFLREIENDNKNGSEFLNIVLLDEANLSPIEHYWSDFSSMYDDDYKKELSVYDDATINFGNNLKFIATINYDHTTEILSDRLISRSPIIKLTTTDFLADEENTNPNIVWDMFRQENLNEWLKPNKDYFKGDIRKRFESIVKVLREDDDSSLGQPIIVSARKQKSVENYCNTAGNLMKSMNQFVALDYAINQNILPLVNGRGDNYKKRLQKLQEKLQGLEQSSKHLNKILKAGDQNFKHYKFFF